MTAWVCENCGQTNAAWDNECDRCEEEHYEPETEQDRIDAEADRLYHELREDGER